MIRWYFYNSYGQFSGNHFSASDDTVLAANTPIGQFAYATPQLNYQTQRYDWGLQQVVNRDPTPVTTVVNTTSVVLSGVPLGALITIGGNASYSVNNTNPAGVVTLNFALPGTYTVAVGCFPSLDYNSSFLLPPAVVPAAGALALAGAAVGLTPYRITVPSGGLVAAGTGLVVPVSAVVPKVATALALSNNIAPVVVSSRVASTATLALTAAAPSLGTYALPTVGSTALGTAGSAPTVVVQTVPVFATGSATLTGNAPVPGWSRVPNVALTVTVNGIASTLLFDKPTVPGSGSLTMELPLLTAAGNANLTGGPALVARSLITTVTGGVTVSGTLAGRMSDDPTPVSAGTLTLLPIDAPRLDVGLIPNVQALTVTGNQPLVARILITPAAGTLALTPDPFWGVYISIH